MNRNLAKILPKRSGRNASGKVTVRHQGGREKRFLRTIDFRRNINDLTATVVAVEYDPNRNANIALLDYPNGLKSYILAPTDMKVGDKITSGKKAEIISGNALPLGNIPIGTFIHNIEIIPGKGGQLVRGAGGRAVLVGKDTKNAIVRLPSGEQRSININCFATIGQVSNPDIKNRKLGKAGRSRHMGIRPTVRGVAQNPDSHPHGGGEGRSGIGMPSPKSPWGKGTLGNRTRKKRKYSAKSIIQRRK